VSDRIAALRRLMEKSPGDARLQFGLAMEYEKQGDWHAVVDTLRTYLAAAEDEGNAWGRLGHALRMLGQYDEAKGAYVTGAKIAREHGHPSMAADFEAILEDWD
jgi:Flp pilus assembly protein TadD